MKTVPQHIAIIMDGNGRYAKKRFLPRTFGHIKGANVLKKIVKYADSIGVKYLTVFAFGRENWKRPEAEVSFLMRFMLKKLNHEINELHQNNGKIRFIGDKSRLNHELNAAVNYAETLTSQNTGLNFNICLDYSGQYDIIQAVNQIIMEKRTQPISEGEFTNYLLTNPSPPPDLLIRTSGEYRLSNFLLWQMAYTELYFSHLMWPEFSPTELDKVITWYQNRERRFGHTSEQLRTP